MVSQLENGHFREGGLLLSGEQHMLEADGPKAESVGPTEKPLPRWSSGPG